MKLQTEQGEIRINNEVFTAITGSAATNCYGVKGMAVRSTTDGLVHLLKRESMARESKSTTTRTAQCPLNSTSLWTMGST